MYSSNNDCSEYENEIKRLKKLLNSGKFKKFSYVEMLLYSRLLELSNMLRYNQ